MASSVINSDDGVISGTAGLKSVGGDDGNLVFQSKGTETARINTDKQIVAAAGTASLPALTTTGDLNTGIFFPAADTIAFGEGGAEAMRINSSGNVGIGTTTIGARLQVNAGTTTLKTYGSSFNEQVHDAVAGAFSQAVWQVGGAAKALIGANSTNMLVNTGGDASGSIVFATGSGTTERMRISSGGSFLVGKTASGFGNVGIDLNPVGAMDSTRNAGTPLGVNRLTNDGILVELAQDTVVEGTISVSGTTVSYNGGNLSRWAQLTTPKDDTPLFKGTVMSNLDEMNVYIAPTTYWTEEDELPVDEEGNPTVAVGDVKVETHEVQNEQLNKVKVSDVEGDANVAGVFVNWEYDEAHQVDEINMAMTGDMIIRIAEGVTVARGDLLMSAGDGTAKPQGDDIVRSKTIAKVTSTHVTCTYDDGSYCVPCVLMAC